MGLKFFEFCIWIHKSWELWGFIIGFRVLKFEHELSSFFWPIGAYRV